MENARKTQSGKQTLQAFLKISWTPETTAWVQGVSSQKGGQMWNMMSIDSNNYLIILIHVFLAIW